MTTLSHLHESLVEGETEMAFWAITVGDHVQLGRQGHKPVIGM